MPKGKAPAAKAKAAPAAAEEPPAKKKKGGPQPGSGAPSNLQKAATVGGTPTIASMLGCRNPELLKVVPPKARAKPAQPAAASSSTSEGSSGQAAAAGFPEPTEHNLVDKRIKVRLEWPDWDGPIWRNGTVETYNKISGLHRVRFDPPAAFDQNEQPVWLQLDGIDWRAEWRLL